MIGTTINKISSHLNEEKEFLYTHPKFVRKITSKDVINRVEDLRIRLIELEIQNKEFDHRVKDRTAELMETKNKLYREIEEHKRTEKRFRESEKKLRVLSRKIIESQENERKLVAKELHDSVNSNLAAIKLALEQKLVSMDSDPRDDIYSIEKVIANIKDTIEEVRRISNHMMPSMLVDLGLLKTIRWFCRERSKYYQKARIITQLKVEEHGINELLKVTIFRVIQEAVTNALNHGEADTIQIDLVKADDCIELSVTDNGCGFDLKKFPPNPDSLNGFGLKGMMDRALVCNGTFEIFSEVGKGTQVKVSLPYR
ncbi:MAG: ATP-binding protein [Desulfobacterales bacterium]